MWCELGGRGVGRRGSKCKLQRLESHLQTNEMDWTVSNDDWSKEKTKIVGSICVTRKCGWAPKVWLSVDEENCLTWLLVLALKFRKNCALTACACICVKVLTVVIIGLVGWWNGRRRKEETGWTDGLLSVLWPLSRQKKCWDLLSLFLTFLRVSCVCVCVCVVVKKRKLFPCWLRKLEMCNEKLVNLWITFFPRFRWLILWQFLDSSPEEKRP